MSDDSLIPPSVEKSTPPFWTRVGAWTVLAALYALLIGMVWFAATLVSSVIKPATPWDDRIVKSLEAAALLIFPARVAWIYIKRKLITGSWLRMTEEEKSRIAARRSARQCGTTKGGACAPRPQSWMKSVLNWAGYTAWSENASSSKRALAWTVLTLYAVFMLAWIALGLLCIGASFADGNTPRQQFLWIFFGLASFFFPAQAIRSNIRRFQATGTFRVSREEFESAAAERAEAQNQQRQRPLGSKIASYAIGAAILAPIWIRATVHRSRHPHETWLTSASLTIVMLYGIWKDFSKSPKIQPQPSASFSPTQD